MPCHAPTGPSSGLINLHATKTCNVDRYSVLTGAWEELEDVQQDNCFSDHSGVATVNDDGTSTIYLFGGYDQDYVGQTTVVTVEISANDELSFSTTTPMPIVSFVVVLLVCSSFVLRLFFVCCCSCSWEHSTAQHSTGLATGGSSR